MLPASGHLSWSHPDDKARCHMSLVGSALVNQVLSLMGIVGDATGIHKIYWPLSPSNSIPHPLGALVAPPLLDWTSWGLICTDILMLNLQPTWPTV